MKVLLVDDHPLIRAALQALITGLGSDGVLHRVTSAREARETLAADGDFDLALLDLQLGDANGFDLLAELRAAYPALPAVAVSASDDSADVTRAIDLGAMGYVYKRTGNETLAEALRMVMSGGIYVPTMALDAMAARRGGGSATGAAPAIGAGVVREPAVAGDDDARPPAPSLAALGITPRQPDVLALLLCGQSNKMIARELGLSVETVKDHVAAVLRALDVGSRTEAVLAVSRMVPQPVELAARRAGSPQASSPSSPTPPR